MHGRLQRLGIAVRCHGVFFPVGSLAQYEVHVSDGRGRYVARVHCRSLQIHVRVHCELTAPIGIEFARPHSAQARSGRTRTAQRGVSARIVSALRQSLVYLRFRKVFPRQIFSYQVFIGYRYIRAQRKLHRVELRRENIRVRFERAFIVEIPFFVRVFISYRLHLRFQFVRKRKFFLIRKCVVCAHLSRSSRYGNHIHRVRLFHFKTGVGRSGVLLFVRQVVFRGFDVRSFGNYIAYGGVSALFQLAAFV